MPALVVLFDAHSAIATPAALKLAGIDRSRGTSTAPPRWSATSAASPTGHLLELPAYELVRASFQPRRPAVRRAGWRTLLRTWPRPG